MVGSFACNATMTLGVAAMVRPLVVSDAARLRLPAVLMLAALVLVIALGSARGRITRARGIVLALR